MKLAAHPLIVAVAFGILPASALEVEGIDVVDAEEPLTEGEWASMPLPSPQAQSDAESAYLQVTGRTLTARLHAEAPPELGPALVVGA